MRKTNRLYNRIVASYAQRMSYVGCLREALAAELISR